MSKELRKYIDSVKTINESEESLIQNFLKKRNEYDEAENAMNEHFSKIVDEMLEKSNTKEDLIKIKERLRVMPESASKVMLFRKIILKEKEIN